MRTLASLLLFAGCAALEPQTSYLPIGAVQGPGDPFPATPYGLGGSFEKGRVQVMAMDSDRLPVGPDAPELYLHLRLLAENTGDDKPWLFNPNDQLLGYDGGMLSAAYALTSTGPPVLSVARGQRGWLDLYYPLPADADPPQVTLWWRVRRGGALLPERTVFLRAFGRNAPVEDADARVESALLPSGLALGWWWPDYCFQSHRPVRYARPSGYSPVSSNSESSSGSSSSDSGSSRSSDSGSWRNPGASAPTSSSGDSSKSAWRR